MHVLIWDVLIKKVIFLLLDIDFYSSLYPHTFGSGYAGPNMYHNNFPYGNYQGNPGHNFGLDTSKVVSAPVTHASAPNPYYFIRSVKKPSTTNVAADAHSFFFGTQRYQPWDYSSLFANRPVYPSNYPIQYLQKQATEETGVSNGDKTAQ